MYYLCSENKGADQLRGVTVKLICVFVFAYADCCFSDEEAQPVESFTIYPKTHKNWIPRKNKLHVILYIFFFYCI